MTIPKSLAGIRSWNIAVGDVDGDGTTETVLAGGAHERAIVAILNSNGTLRKTFDVYGRSFTGGLELAVGDLDLDGRAEILTAPAGHGGPDVRVFDSAGRLQFRFNAFGANFRGGVRLAVGNLLGDSRREIVTAAGPDGEPHVRIFSSTGQFTGKAWYAFERTVKTGVRVAVGDVDGDGQNEIVAAAGENPARVSIRTPNGTQRSSFTAFPTGVVGAARLTTLDVNADGRDEVIVAPGSDKRILRALSLSGSVVQTMTPPASTSGIALAAEPESKTLVVVPNRPSITGRTDLHRYIEVDISDQRLRMYEDGVLLGERMVSTGKWSMPTPLGTFSVRNKMPVAYSKKYNLYMDWWMAFTPDGAYGLHSLPYWKLSSGRLYEGENHLGVRVSHGCIRQKLTDAKSLYDWATIGTPVVVRP